MNRNRGNILAGMLLTVAIIAILVVVMMYGGFRPTTSARKDKLGKTSLGLAKLGAKDDICRSNLKQIRMSIQINSSTEDQPPASLDDLKLPAEMLKCPVGDEKYEYDPATGTVKCPHPGHEEY